MFAAIQSKQNGAASEVLVSRWSFRMSLLLAQRGSDRPVLNATATESDATLARDVPHRREKHTGDVYNINATLGVVASMRVRGISPCAMSVDVDDKKTRFGYDM